MSKEKKSMEDIHKIMEDLYNKRAGMSTEEIVREIRLVRKIHGRLLVQGESQVYDIRLFLLHNKYENHKLF